MEPALELLHNVILDHGRVTLTLYREDFSALYPGMARFELTVSSGGRVLDVFRTNTYEYTVPESITAETVALHKTAEWEDAIRDIRAREGTDRQVSEMVKTCFRRLTKIYLLIVSREPETPRQEGD